MQSWYLVWYIFSSYRIWYIFYERCSSLKGPRASKTSQGVRAEYQRNLNIRGITVENSFITYHFRHLRFKAMGHLFAAPKRVRPAAAPGSRAVTLHLAPVRITVHLV